MPNPRTIEGVYRDGRVELSEIPPGVREARVRVVFLDEQAEGEGNGARHGASPPLTPAGALGPKPVLPSAVVAVPTVADESVPTAWQWTPPDDAAAGAILDYASPRAPKGRVRLPATSQLACRRDGQSAAIVERLSGQVQAIYALFFAGVVLLVVGKTVVSYFTTHPSKAWAPAYALAALWLAEAVLIPLVINNTWRQTVLTATADTLTLRFTSPFKSKEYIWRTDQVEDLRLVRTQGKPPALAELQVLVVGQPLVKLFTDHLERELVPMRDTLLSAMGRVGADARLP